MRKLLTHNYDKRISAEDALKHPWVAKMSDPEHVSKSVTVKTLKNLRNFRVGPVQEPGRGETQAGHAQLHREPAAEQGGEGPPREDLQAPRH